MSTAYGYATGPVINPYGAGFINPSAPRRTKTIQPSGSRSSGLGIGGLISMAGSIYTGITAFNAANAYAEDLRYEGGLLYAESMRTAAIIVEEGQKFAAAQSLQYIGSGVEVMGSALVTIAQTKKYAATEAQAERARGQATRNLYEKRAGRAEDEGRAALVGGIIGGVANLVGA